MGRLKLPDPVIFVIVALLCAAGLVVYLQHRAMRAFDRQTVLILQKVAQQTLMTAMQEIRRTFDGPVYDTLASVNHPYLVASRYDIVEREFDEGLDTYPQVERFFVWRGVQESAHEDDVLFYGRQDRQEKASGADPAASDPLASFTTDPALARVVLKTARRYARSQQIYAAIDERVNGTPYEVFVRVFYTDASRSRYFAVLGFVVNLETVREHLFATLVSRQLARLLDTADGSPPFDLRVFDETGELVFGSDSAPPPASAEATMPLKFYPVDNIRTRLAADVPAPQWRLVVSPRAHSAPELLATTRRQNSWLSALSVLLMLVALGFALQMRKRALQLTRMQADFVAHVSHQLKTPVSLLSAVGETMALERVRSPEKLAQCVDVVCSSTARLSSLVERILQFSRVSDGARRFEIEAVELAPLVRETVDSFAAGLTVPEMRVEVELEGRGPTVAADPIALEQAVVNLLDNAIKYSGGSRVVVVRVGTVGQDGVVEIVDRGIGIHPHDRAHIFERFYRGAGASVRQHGFGLGLPIAHELVAGQRGSIEVSETPGGGSTFRIRMPGVDWTNEPVGTRRPWLAWLRLHVWPFRANRVHPKEVA